MTTTAIDSVTLKDLTESFAYLDAIRESGAVNMFGAAVYLNEMMPEVYGVPVGYRERPTALASAAHAAWMRTFDGASDAETRARRALEDSP
jgi:hypothetical protein